MNSNDSISEVLGALPTNQLCIDSRIPNEISESSDINQNENELLQPYGKEKQITSPNKQNAANYNETFFLSESIKSIKNDGDNNEIHYHAQSPIKPENDDDPSNAELHHTQTILILEKNGNNGTDLYHTQNNDEEIFRTQSPIKPENDEKLSHTQSSTKLVELNGKTKDMAPDPMDQGQENHNMQLQVEINQSSFIDESNNMEMETSDLERTINNEKDINDDDVKKYDLYHNTLIELGRRLWPSTPDQQHYTKGCLWSPDGTCLLVPVHLDGMHVMDLPSDLYKVNQVSKERSKSELPTTVHVKEGGTVYDYTWYPYMTSSDPDTCCWLASRQHEPIHMWDAYTGQLRCTYRGYDAVDEIETAISLLFSDTGEKIFGGYKKSIKIFDTAVPGRDYISIPVKQTVSCMAVTNDNNRCVTTGSWNSFIYHYDLRAIKLGPLFALSGHSAGITWLHYMEDDSSEWYLFSGARKDNKIIQWDMRNYKKPWKIYERNVSTNQRIYFEVDPFFNKWLISGDTKGYLNVWNLQNATESLKIPLHKDCCNGANFHPTLPIMATTSGQYHFIGTSMPDDQEMKSQKTNTDDDTTKRFDYENCLLLTWFGMSH